MTDRPDRFVDDAPFDPTASALDLERADLDAPGFDGARASSASSSSVSGRSGRTRA